MTDEEVFYDRTPHDRFLERQAEETPLSVFQRHVHRWPELLIWVAVVATAMLAATGWIG